MKEPRRPLEELVKGLPQAFREEARDFVAFLLEKRAWKAPRRQPRFDWAGALKGLRDRYTSEGRICFLSDSSLRSTGLLLCRRNQHEVSSRSSEDRVG